MHSSLEASSLLEPVILIVGLNCACSRRLRLSAAAVIPPQAEGDAINGGRSSIEYFLPISDTILSTCVIQRSITNYVRSMYASHSSGISISMTRLSEWITAAMRRRPIIVIPVSTVDRKVNLLSSSKAGTASSSMRGLHDMARSARLCFKATSRKTLQESS